VLRRAASARYRLRPLRARIGLVCLALALLLVPVGIASNGTHVSGTISANTTWTVAGSPYVIDGNLTVAAGVTLTVDPGVVVKFNGSLRAMFVNGTLKAVGTEAQPIVFTSIQDDTVGGDSNGDGAATSPAPGQWYHIGITAGTASEFRYATVRYGGNGSANWGYGAISVSGVGTSVTIDHATITNNQRSGIKIFEGGATVSASTISSNGNGISANQGWMALKERTYVTSNSDAGLWFNLTSSYTGPASSVLDSDIAGNGGHGVEIGAAQTLPAARFPYGNRNNIYANAAKQLYHYYTRRDVDWSGNFWGANIYHWTNPSVCLGTGQNARGRLAPRPTSSPPGTSPFQSSAYTAGSPATSCYYDKIKIEPGKFSPYYLGDTPVIPIDQTYGGLSDSGHSKGLGVYVFDPVNAATGGFTHETTDLSLPGTGVSFEFKRTYNSLDPTSSPLGMGWQHNHAPSLTIKANGDVSARLEDGQQFEYVLQSDGSFARPPGALSTLASVTGGYELIRNDQVKYRFDSQGRAASVKDRNEQGLTYDYDGSGRLSTITDAANRQVTLAYDGAGLLASVTSSDGRSVSYGYTNGRLASVTDAASKVWTYVYESRGLLEKEIDPLARTVFRNVYDQDGRVIEQYDALNNKTTFAWDYTTQTASITDARNKLWSTFSLATCPPSTSTRSTTRRSLVTGAPSTGRARQARAGRRRR
jgi:YD repeat-containing protein